MYSVTLYRRRKQGPWHWGGTGVKHFICPAPWRLRFDCSTDHGSRSLRLAMLFGGSWQGREFSVAAIVTRTGWFGAPVRHRAELRRVACSSARPPCETLRGQAERSSWQLTLVVYTLPRPTVGCNDRNYTHGEKWHNYIVCLFLCLY